MVNTQVNLYEKLLEHVRGGLLGPREGKGITADLVREDECTTTFTVALIALPPSSDAVDRHIVQLSKGGHVVTKKRIEVSELEMAETMRHSKLGKLKDFKRLNNGVHGITYQVSVDDPGSPQFVVQLRSHGNVGSMNALQRYFSQAALPSLPVPKVYPSSEERDDGLQLQISEFVPGAMASDIYPALDLNGKKMILQRLARTFQSIWESPVSQRATSIGEASFSSGQSSTPEISIYAERSPGAGMEIGGPFQSVSAYLKAWVKHRFTRLQEQNGVDEYKAEVLGPIQQFFETEFEAGLPAQVDQIPIVLAHADLGLHNIIVAPEKPWEFKAVIDWEFTSYQPFLTAIPELIDPLFRPDGSSPGDQAELREAFWDEIPQWAARKNSAEGRAFLSWYEFGLYLKPNPYLDLKAPVEEKLRFWSENISVVKRFLKL
ncbi:hypothetical protein FGRMN_6853 [Fusarium graminum]|nr:hypothetical protein FGRMN_6853 [Fusarium graminum]